MAPLEYCASVLVKKTMPGLGMEARPDHTSRTKMRKTAKVILSRRLFIMIVNELYQGKGTINRERGAKGKKKRGEVFFC
jgi:hypothetical protein